MKKRNRKRKLTRSQKGISLIALTTTIFAAVNLKNTKILKGIHGIAITNLHANDVIRHPLVQKIIERYSEIENS